MQKLSIVQEKGFEEEEGQKKEREREREKKRGGGEEFGKRLIELIW